MSDQYVFELQFKGKADGSDYRENQFVIIDGSSMAEFSKLKEDLGMCMPEPFTVQYIDDEDDVISIDTEEEFQEFARLAKQRSSRGMLMRLVLNSNLPLDHGMFMTSHDSRKPAQPPKPPGCSISTGSKYRQSPKMPFQEFKDKIKAELKKEILSELKELGPGPQASTSREDSSLAAAGSSKDCGPCERMEEDTKDADFEEDSDGNLWYIPEKNLRKTKQMHSSFMHYQKKLEKKEKLVEAKIDQRLEKLEMKRKKLMEKYSHKIFHKHALDMTFGPKIISAIATEESSECKNVTSNKSFTHVWTIINDGTVALKQVELRHTWSSMELEPAELAVKLPALLPGQQCTVPVKFRVHSAPGALFVSYWHFHRLEDSRWVEFGHFVRLVGTTKSLKSSAPDVGDVKMFESNKKAKHDGKKAVTFMDFNQQPGTAAAAAETPAAEPQKEEKVLNQESNITLKKQMEQLQATLASSEIAADMAREAARLLAMASATEGNTAPGKAGPKPSEGDKLNNCGLEEAAAGVQQLNLVDSESDTDANMETNEESDRGFVLVNMTREPSTDDSAKKSMKDMGRLPAQCDNTKAETQPQPDAAMPKPDLSNGECNLPNPPHTFYLPPRVANMSVLGPQPLIPHNVYNFPPVFPPTPNASSHGIVFPPPVNYPPIPIHTYGPHGPTLTIPCPAPSFSPVSQPMAPQQAPHHPINMFCYQNVSEAPHETHHPHYFGQGSPAADTAATPVDKPAETQAPAQEVNAAEVPEANPPSEAASRQEQLQEPQQQQTVFIPQTEEQKKNGDQVQILPQALVDGAINVAATAYSTAWNALNNLRPKEGEASEFDPVFENNMAMLVEMGFNNLERNARLLKRFNNDISQVIGIICSTGGGAHNLDID